MEKIKTILDKKASKELLSTTFALAWSCFGISLFCIVLYFFFGILLKEWSDASLITALIIGVIIFIFSLFVLFYLSNNLKKANSYVREAIYEFTDDALLYEVYQNGEKIEEGKTYYRDIVDYKVTKNYIYLRLRNNTYFCVNKVDGLLDFIANKGISKHKIINATRKQ